MSQNFNLQQFIAQIPKLANETDLEQVFNVMNVVANMPLSIDLKKHLLSQMETKLKDNPNFQKIAETHQLQLKQLQQILAGNNVQVTAEKKEENKKQKQENQASQQFNLQQLNMLKGLEMVKYVLDHIKTQEDFNQLSEKNKLDLAINTFGENSDKLTKAGKAEVTAYYVNDQKNANILNKGLQSNPKALQNFSHSIYDPEYVELVRKRQSYLSGREVTTEQVKMTLQTIARSAEKGIYAFYDHQTGNLIIEPDTYENRKKLAQSIEEEKQYLTKAKNYSFLDLVSLDRLQDEVAYNEMKSQNLFNQEIKGITNKSLYESFSAFSQEFEKVGKITKDYNVDIRIFTCTVMRIEHNTPMGQLLHAQVTMYLAGENKDILNNPIFREIFAECQKKQDKNLMLNALEGMWFDREAGKQIYKMMEKDLENNPKIQPDQTIFDEDYYQKTLEERNNYYHVTVAISQHIDENIKGTEVYDMFRRINNGEELTKKDLYILGKIKSLEDNPNIQYKPLIRGTSITATNSEILEKFHQATNLTIDEILEKHNKNGLSSNISENPNKIMAVADMDKTRQAFNEIQKNGYSIQQQTQPSKTDEEEQDTLNYTNNVNTGSFNT
ncbi:hypothetical protein [Lonepinella sp. BR2474]|uniref:hypothetical protein n=1 Tax=Lonepinella sp. BR2474 TaxID=3434548 RepID=UPI003F6E413E